MSNHVALAVVDAVSPKVSVLPVELLRYFVVAACKITHVVMCASRRDKQMRTCGGAAVSHRAIGATTLRRRPDAAFLGCLR